MSPKEFMLILYLIGVQISHHRIIMTHFRSSYLLFDFQRIHNLEHWSEISDTVRREGKSKATFDIYKTHTKQFAIFFSMLNPLPNGACFSGVSTITNDLNLEDFKYISFKCTTQGQASTYKIILRNNDLNEKNPTYEHKFKVHNGSETKVKLALSHFEPYYRGKKIDGHPLNVKNITSFGIQVAGGVYDDVKQSGVSSLVVDRIWATQD